ncbi:MAG: DUF3488 and transglutaminase-like domain-containing protein [Polyangiales bacterium]
MSFARLQKLVTYLLAALGLLALGFGSEVSVGARVLLGLGFVASWFVEGTLLTRPAWSRTITGFLLFVLAIQIVRGVFTEAGWLGLAMEFAGLLTLSRLANRRTAADYQQVAMLAFIQLIAATVLTTDLSYAGLFIAFVVATPWVLTFAHLRREIERNYPVAPDGQGSADLARVLASRRIVDPRFLLWTALLSVPMLVMTVGLFVFFPRIGLGMLSFGSERGQHVSGFGNDVTLGGFGVIRSDPTVVMRVTVSRPLGPLDVNRVLRLRGTSFDAYDGERWTRSESDSVKMSPIGEYYPLKRLAGDDDLTLRIVLDQLDEPVVFVPTGAVGLRLPQRGLPGTGERVTLMRAPGLDLRYRSGDDGGLVYEASVSVAPSEGDVAVDRELDAARYLALPPGHERVVALARSLTEGIDDPAKKAKRLEYYLRGEKRFAYALELPDVRGKPPLEGFLFDAKRGHCEYFSSALAVMLRAVGIPARNVTGYLGGEYNRYGGYYAVRQADAHSWVEALLPGRGWVTYEPTPSARDRIGPSAWFRDVRAMIDAVRAYWITQVVGYDLRSQLRGIRELRRFFQGLSWGGRGDDGHETKKPGTSGGPLDTAWLGGIAAALVLGAAALWLARRLKRRRAARALSDSARAARRLYRELEDVLARRGLARPAHVTPEAHARALTENGFTGAAAVRDLTDAYVRARYGAYELDPARLDALRARLVEVRRAA